MYWGPKTSATGVKWEEGSTKPDIPGTQISLDRPDYSPSLCTESRASFCRAIPQTHPRGCTGDKAQGAGAQLAGRKGSSNPACFQLVSDKLCASLSPYLHSSTKALNASTGGCLSPASACVYALRGLFEKSSPCHRWLQTWPCPGDSLGKHSRSFPGKSLVWFALGDNGGHSLLLCISPVPPVWRHPGWGF